MTLNKRFLPFILCFLPLLVNSQNYFQQEVNYKIAVRLDDVKHELSATEEMDYFNNSTATLNEIYIHLWPNAYKDNSTALVKQKLENGDMNLFYALPSERGYIDNLAFTVDGEKVTMQYDSANIDIAKLILNKPLLPGKRIIIQTPFHVKLPSARFSRMGHLGQSYMITQWYPKVAVYDRYGWHSIPYLDEGEFYSEFGSFDVTITVPQNYVVSATGDLQNQEEMEWLNKKAEETKEIKVFSHEMGFPLSSDKFKTLQFKQEKVHDFAWFADKRYHVLKGSVELPHTKEKVTTWAMFTNNEADLWKKSIEYINQAIYYYSLWNGDYPYHHCTAVDGTIAAGTGMEYPNITVIGESKSDFTLEDVIVHEVGHNWFYGILGSNERDHAWMDEGINSFNELRYVYTRYPGEYKSLLARLGFDFVGDVFGFKELTFKDDFYYSYDFVNKTYSDQPIDITSSDYTLINYGTIVYTKTALIFDYLKSYLGDSVFDNCMHNYYETWKFKHPYPEDVKTVFENISGKKLDWFFNNLIKTTGKIDYKIAGIKSMTAENLINPAGHSYILKLKNKGNIASPFIISGLRNGKIVNTHWYEGFEKNETITISCTECESFRIDADKNIPELNRNNNTIRAKGFLRKLEPLSFHFLGKVEDGAKTQVFFLPTVGWNKYNNWMAGIAFYNKLLPVKPFEFFVMPMYSFGTKNIAGSADATLNFYPKTTFQTISLTGSISHYAFNKWEAEGSKDIDFNFTRIVPSLEFKFKKSIARSPIIKSVKLESIHVITDQPLYTIYSADKNQQYDNYNRVTFKFLSATTFDPYRFSIVAEQGKDFVKSSFEFNYHFNYVRSRKGIDFRFFFGTFIKNDAPGYYNWRMSGISGLATGTYQDYAFDETFLGRSEYEGWTSRQFYEKDGAFKVYAPLNTDKWLSSVNLKIDLPMPLPVRIFFDAGTYYNAKDAFTGSQSLVYDGGFSVFVIKNVMEVYFPLFVSSDINQIEKANDVQWRDRIRFVINFNAINPFELRKHIFNN